MRASSAREATYNWDIARLPPEAGRAGRAAWAETFPARALGHALTLHHEFWEDVAAVRADTTAAQRLARRYVRRDQGGRLAAVAVYLERAAAAPNDRDAKMAVWATGMRAWFVDGDLEPGQPARDLRRDVVHTISIGAYRVARRGAGRCLSPPCAHWRGTKLAQDARGEFCTACATVVRRPRELDEAERALFDALIPVVLREPSRPRARRARRASAPRD